MSKPKNKKNDENFTIKGNVNSKIQLHLLPCFEEYASWSDPAEKVLELKTLPLLKDNTAYIFYRGKGDGIQKNLLLTEKKKETEEKKKNKTGYFCRFSC